MIKERNRELDRHYRVEAAAEDLLAACKSVELDLAKLAFQDPYNPQRLLDLRMTLTAAIAKAEA